jgi:hypothetical protein
MSSFPFVADAVVFVFVVVPRSLVPLPEPDVLDPEELVPLESSPLDVYPSPELAVSLSTDD